MDFTPYLPYLQLLTTTAGAGWLAQLIFKQFRSWFPLQSNETPHGFVATILYSPRWARWSNFVLAGAVSGLATLAFSYVTTTNYSIEFQAAVSIVLGQIFHSLTQSGAIPALPTPTETPTETPTV